MALAYVPPGVNVAELSTPSVSPLLAAPANVCIIGTAQGYIQRTDPVALTNQDNVVLPRFPQGNATLDQPVLEVSSADNPQTTYIEGTDFVVNYSTQVNEVQIVTITATGGTFTLTFGDETTGTIAYNATSATVQSDLEALANIDPGDVTVTGSAGGPWTLTFGGQYQYVNVGPVVGDGSALTGGSTDVTVETVTEGGELATIRRTNTGAIAQGETVNVVYRYLPNDYYLPTRLDELSSVEDRYGPAFDGKNINSQVSYAASIAFDNGANEVIIQPLFRLTTDSDPSSVKRAPTPAEVQSATTWEQTLYSLRDIDDINIIVPIVGQSTPGLIDSEWLAIIQKLQAHLKVMRDQQQFVFGIFGEDSSTSSNVAQKATLRSHAQTLESTYNGAVNEQMIFVSPSKFTRVNPATSQDFYVGGQWVAAGIAGMLAGISVSTSITRNVVSGFTSVADPRSKADKNLDAQNGLLVVEQKANGLVQVRHGITTDNSATAKREIPVVRAKYRMIESVRDTIDTQIIGKVIADGDAPTVVAAAVTGVLEALKTVKDLVDYSAVQARTLSLDPTTVEVRFSYKPAFPLNYVNIAFSIDLTSGTTTSVTTG